MVQPSLEPGANLRGVEEASAAAVAQCRHGCVKRLSRLGELLAEVGRFQLLPQVVPDIVDIARILRGDLACAQSREPVQDGGLVPGCRNDPQPAWKSLDEGRQQIDDGSLGALPSVW